MELFWFCSYRECQNAEKNWVIWRTGRNAWNQRPKRSAQPHIRLCLNIGTKSGISSEQPLGFRRRKIWFFRFITEKNTNFRENYIWMKCLKCFSHLTTNRNAKQKRFSNEWEKFSLNWLIIDCNICLKLECQANNQYLDFEW